MPTLEEEVVLLGDEPEPQEAQELLHLPLNARKPQKLKNQPSSLTLYIHLPLHPWPQTPVGTSPRTPGEASAGLDPSVHQPPIQTAPTTGSRHT